MTEQHHKIGIFLVDDDPDTLALVELILKKRGYEIVTAKDGEEAIMRLTTDHFDLIISDVDMPRLDGMRLLELLRMNAVKTPLIFLTANTSASDEEQARANGALDYIHKPVKKEVLADRVMAVLADIDKNNTKGEKHE